MNELFTLTPAVWLVNALSVGEKIYEYDISVYVSVTPVLVLDTTVL